MAWTYSRNPGASNKDAVRFYVQDVFEKTPYLQDEEIEFAIAEEAGEEPDSRGLLSSAALCCELLADRFAMQPDTLIGSLQITTSKAAQIFGERADKLRARAQGAGLPFVGGQTHSEKRTRRMEPDRVQPLFRRGQFREPHQIRDGDIHPGGIA
jgi:hypothetical protein